MERDGRSEEEMLEKVLTDIEKTDSEIKFSAFWWSKNLGGQKKTDLHP